MIITSFVITEASIAVIGVFGALGGCIVGIMKASSCEKLSICGIVKCEKPPQITGELGELEMGNSISGRTNNDLRIQMETQRQKIQVQEKKAISEILEKTS